MKEERMDEGMGIKWDRQREKELTEFHKRVWKQKERTRSIKKDETKDGRHEEGRRNQGRERRDGLCRATGGGLKEGHVSGSVAEVRTAEGTHSDI